MKGNCGSFAKHTNQNVLTLILFSKILQQDQVDLLRKAVKFFETAKLYRQSQFFSHQNYLQLQIVEHNPTNIMLIYLTEDQLRPIARQTVIC